MADYATPEDRANDGLIVGWIDDVRDMLDQMEAWRAADPEDRFKPHGPPKLPKHFYGNTQTLVSRLTRNYPTVDNSPMMDVYTALKVWCDELSEDNIPSPSVLEGTFERAVMLLNTAWDDIRCRMKCSVQDQAILDMTCRLTETWSPVDQDGLSAAEQKALSILVQVGNVEERVTATARMDGFPQTVRATCVLNGNYVDALNLRVVELVPEWRDAEGKTRGRLMLKPESLEARLTIGGVTARHEVKAGDTDKLFAFIRHMGKEEPWGRAELQDYSVESESTDQPPEPETQTDAPIVGTWFMEFEAYCQFFMRRKPSSLEEGDCLRRDYVNWASRFQKASEALAALAEQRNIDSSPVHTLTGNLDGHTGIVLPLSVTEEQQKAVWDNAWNVAKRLNTILEAEHEPTPPRPTTPSQAETPESEWLTFLRNIYAQKATSENVFPEVSKSVLVDKAISLGLDAPKAIFDSVDRGWLIDTNGCSGSALGEKYLIFQVVLEDSPVGPVQDGPSRRGKPGWWKSGWSPHLDIPPEKWEILDAGHFQLDKPVKGGLGGLKDGLFCNSAGQPYDPQPGIIWTVEEYLRHRNLYKEAGKRFCPGLLKGSPALDTYFAELRVKRMETEAAANSEADAANSVVEELKDAAPATAPLNDRQHETLVAMLQLNAVGPDSRRTTEDIVITAAGKNADPNQYKEVMAELGRLGYVETKKGRGGGCWLTAAGKARAERLSGKS